ncbi:MAG TPA: winged helix-turn-helix domain-containing protein [Burkholderiaceae bacterium]|nr:winged helix-turn-helix domain-containing protein [Burkholderiaceae bacterium]
MSSTDSPPQDRIYRFGAFALDTRRGSLMRGTQNLELRPKSFTVLLHLVRNAGRLVPKSELVQSVWPDVVVTDDALNKCIGDIRSALGDSEQAIVKTVPRRGYLFAEPVAESPGLSEPVGQPPIGPAAPEPRSRRDGQRRMLLLATLILVAVAGLLTFWWVTRVAPPALGPASIAVLSFSSGEGDAGSKRAADGLAEDVTTALSRFAGLAVIAPNSALAYQQRPRDAKAIATELGVRYVLDGTLRRDGLQMLVTVRLIDGRVGKQLWAERYDRPFADVFEVRDEISRKIAISLVKQVSKAELERGTHSRRQDLVAWDHYLRGNAALRSLTEGSRAPLLIEARTHFRAALAVEPRYAPALQALAQTYTAAWLEPTAVEPIKSEYQKQSTLDQAQSLAEQAIEIDPFLAEAHATLAWILNWQYQRPAGLASFRRALELNPNLAEGRFGIMLAQAGHPDEAVEEMKRIMRLDPHHPALDWTWLGNAHYLAGNYESALEALRIASSRQPKHRPTHVWLAAAAAQAGHDEEARRAADVVLTLQPDFSGARFLRLVRHSRQQDADRLAEGLRKAGLPM